MNYTHQQQIESYLAGEMSAEEISAFESQVEVNPELKQELNFQSEVIKGIGEFRKAQLFARLDGLNVSTAWWSVIQHSSVLQYVGAATAVIGISGAAYWFVSSDEQVLPESGNEIIVNAPVYEPLIFDLPEIDNEEELLSGKRENADVFEEKTSEVADQLKNEKAFNPVVNVPSAGDVAVENEFKAQEAPNPDELEESTTNKSLEVEVVETKTSKIKYRYYGGKLFLYGKFQDEPYQILEINSTVGRRIYLYHLNTFYQISQSDKPLSLTEVTDNKLIQELSILRKSK